MINLLQRLKNEPLRVRIYGIAVLVLGYLFIKKLISLDDVQFYIGLAGLILGVEASRAKVTPVDSLPPYPTFQLPSGRGGGTSSSGSSATVTYSPGTLPPPLEDDVDQDLVDEHLVEVTTACDGCGLSQEYCESLQNVELIGATGRRCCPDCSHPYDEPAEGSDLM